MQTQVDMDAINVNAELWLSDFLTRFQETWMKGLEQPQQEQPEALPEEAPVQQEQPNPEALGLEGEALLQQFAQQQQPEVANAT